MYDISESFSFVFDNIRLGNLADATLFYGSFLGSTDTLRCLVEIFP
jgi:hypothetical protein